MTTKSKTTKTVAKAKPMSPKREKGHWGIVRSSRKEAVAIALDSKGRSAAIDQGNALGLSPATVLSWIRTWVKSGLAKTTAALPSRLPQVEGNKPAKKKFKSYPIGYFHIDIAEVQTAEGKLYLFVAIDRTSKFAYVELHERATK